MRLLGSALRKATEIKARASHLQLLAQQPLGEGHPLKITEATELVAQLDRVPWPCDPALVSELRSLALTVARGTRPTVADGQRAVSLAATIYAAISDPAHPDRLIEGQRLVDAAASVLGGAGKRG